MARAPVKAQKACWNCIFLRGEQCQFYPPQIAVLRNEVVSKWPEVKPNDWCGQWRHAAQEVNNA